MRALLIAAAAPVAACAQMAAAELPSTLVPADGTRATLTLAARGVQLYECRAGAWAFVAPEAELFDHLGRRVGSHGAGPIWQADDGSRVAGRPRARAEAPRPDAIPWLLLDASPAAAPGAFSGVVAIQRTDTEGGVAPDTPCTADRVGSVARVPYRAEYRFFTQQ